MTDQPPRANRTRLYVPIAIATLLLGGYTALWLYGARVMRAEIDQWTQDERASGREVRRGEVAIRGFPGTLRAMIEAPYWSEPGEWSWSAEQLIIVTLPYDPSRLIFTPRGEQSVTYDGRDFALRTDDLRVSVEAGSVVAQATGLTMQGDRQTLTLGRGLVNLLDDGAGGQVAGLELGDVTIDTDTDAGSGDSVDDGAERIVLPYLRAAASASGGTASVEAFQAALAPSAGGEATSVAGEGRASLGQGGVPEGRFEVRIRNPGPLVDLAVAQGLLPADQAQTTLSLVGSMANADGEVVLPLTMADGRLRVGFIPVAELPRLGR